MKTASPQLLTLLAGNQFLMADLYTVTLNSGTVYRWTSCDRNIKEGAFTYESAVLERTTTRLTMGVEVDTLNITVHPSSDMLIENLPFVVAARIGALDGATILLQRAFFNSFDLPSVGVVHVFEGNVAVDYVDGVSAQLTVKSLLNIFNIEMPRNEYSPGCNNTLYDTACGVSRAARLVAGTVLAGSTRQVINHGLSQSAGYFDSGVLEYLTGANAGTKITISKHLSGTLALAVPLKATPAAGDAFNIYPGCDRTLDSCTNKFNNIIRFRGMPWIPKPETAY